MVKIFSKLYSFFSGWTGTIILVLFIIFFVAQSFVIPSASMQNTMLIGDNLFVKKFIYGVPIPRLPIPFLEFPLLPDFNGNGHLIEGERPKRGDIVIFRYPLDDTQHYVKRLVGVEGDEIIYTKKGLYFRPSEGDSYIATHFAGDEKRNFMGKIFVYDPYLRMYPGVQYLKERNSFDELFYVQQMGGDVAMQLLSEKGEPFFYHKVQEGHFFMMGDNRNASSDSRFWGSVEYRHIVGAPWRIWFSVSNEDYRVRWNRIGKSIEELEEEERQKRLQAQKVSEQDSNTALQEAAEELAKEK